MDQSTLEQPPPPAGRGNRMVTLACAGLFAFSAFHLVTGYQSFLRYKTFLESDSRQIERCVSMFYSVHPSLIRANLIDDLRLRYHVAGQME